MESKNDFVCTVINMIYVLFALLQYCHSSFYDKKNSLSIDSSTNHKQTKDIKLHITLYTKTDKSWLEVGKNMPCLHSNKTIYAGLFRLMRDSSLCKMYRNVSSYMNCY